MRLSKKIAIVTGASSGMGHAIALLFAKEGATVIAVARRKERLEALVQQAKEQNGVIVAYQGDVSDQAAMEALIDWAIKEYGRLDILVNNAGIMDDMTSVAEVSDELWARILNVNLTGPFVLCRKAVRQMLEQGGGNIINVASVGGLQGSRAGAAYTASKFALVGLSKNIGFMYANKGIRCNVICPGGVETEIMATLQNAEPFGLARATSGAANNPRTGKSEEIATVALFLASDESSFVNGAALAVDGGWTAY